MMGEKRETVWSLTSNLNTEGLGPLGPTQTWKREADPQKEHLWWPEERNLRVVGKGGSVVFKLGHR